MTKEVMVSIRGLQFDQEMDSEEIETIQWGQYYKKNDTHYIIYDELMEGCDEPTRNIIKFKEHEMNLTKRGTVNVYMVFEENKKNMTSYLTPYGSILIGLDTSRVTFTEEEKEISVNVDYALEVNYEYLADCRIEMHIRPKDGGRNQPALLKRTDGNIKRCHCRSAKQVSAVAFFAWKERS